MSQGTIVGLFVVVMLVLCVRLSGEMYHRKGHDKWLGYALGLLGPIGLLVVAFTPAVDRRRMHRCIHCRRWIPDAAVRCPKCGRGIEVVNGLSKRATSRR